METRRIVEWEVKGDGRWMMQLGLTEGCHGPTRLLPAPAQAQAQGSQGTRQDQDTTRGSLPGGYSCGGGVGAVPLPPQSTPGSQVRIWMARRHLLAATMSDSWMGRVFQTPKKRARGGADVGACVGCVYVGGLGVWARAAVACAPRTR